MRWPPPVNAGKAPVTAGRAPVHAGRALLVLAATLVVVLAAHGAVARPAAAYTNPTIPEIRAKLAAAGAAHGIPPEVLYGIAFQESTWRQFDANGDPLIGYDGLGIGLMQVTSYVLFGFDVERLKTDIDYNIACGIEILLEKRTWTPRIGDGSSSCYENWFYAVWAYNAWTAFNPYPYQVWSHIATGPEGWWTGVPVTPVPTSALVGGLGVAMATPQPAHYWNLAVTVTAPSVASSWPSGSVQTVSWTVAPAVAAAGEFRVWLIDQATGIWYVSRQVPPVEGRTSYSTQVTAAVPAGRFKAAVYWRPTVGSGDWAATAKGAAFTVTPVNITAPAAAAVWPAQATGTLSWTVSPYMTGGEFRVWLIDQTSGAWYVNKAVAAVAGKTGYSTAVNTLMPPGAYKAAVYWRATSASAWGATQKSAVFTIAALAISSPTASSSWPRLTTQSVAWSAAPGLAGGEFRVSLVDQASGTWYVNKTVAVVPGQGSYDTSLPVTVPVGAYKAAVYWRPTPGASSWVLARKTAAFAVTQ